MLVGSIEAGGTKFVCAVGDTEYNIIDSHHFATTSPDSTLSKVIDYFRQFKISALGVASFGPLDLDRQSPNFGSIMASPKLDWRNIPIYEILKKQLQVPIFLTTDVNGSAYGEYIVGRLRGQQLNSLVYYTVGTGVGAGVIYNGKFIGDLGHPEMGHVFVKRHPKDRDFTGVCHYHHDCLEGLVSGPTFEVRLGKRGENVSLNDPVWDVMAYYMAQALIQTTMTLRPSKFVLGGSVLNDTFIQKIRDQYKKLINDYISLPPLESYIVRPLVENNGSATIGNFALALNQIQKDKN
ncbi:ROK family protein [Levilactobacillus zymae]|uniref:ROK family protein n=1 Tax=Levilactobacillus zymae TaxID=267363 RepID=UPI0028B6CA89|nr:ROK family protein [Levilactobacillus zymae]MDT6979249.1 ROK family protein [Levilactobacillus zymae]